jgi:hypothetical protein
MKVFVEEMLLITSEQSCASFLCSRKVNVAFCSSKQRPKRSPRVKLYKSKFERWHLLKKLDGFGYLKKKQSNWTLFLPGLTSSE